MLAASTLAAQTHAVRPYSAHYSLPASVLAASALAASMLAASVLPAQNHAVRRYFAHYSLAASTLAAQTHAVRPYSAHYSLAASTLAAQTLMRSGLTLLLHKGVVNSAAQGRLWSRGGGGQRLPWFWEGGGTQEQEGN